MFAKLLAFTGEWDQYQVGRYFKYKNFNVESVAIRDAFLSHGGFNGVSWLETKDWQEHLLVTLFWGISRFLSAFCSQELGSCGWCQFEGVCHAFLIVLSPVLLQAY